LKTSVQLAPKYHVNEHVSLYYNAICLCMYLLCHPFDIHVFAAYTNIICYSDLLPHTHTVTFKALMQG